jgi:hypothetical protein
MDNQPNSSSLTLRNPIISCEKVQNHLKFTLNFISDGVCEKLNKNHIIHFSFYLPYSYFHDWEPKNNKMWEGYRSLYRHFISFFGSPTTYLVGEAFHRGFSNYIRVAEGLSSSLTGEKTIGSTTCIIKYI